MKAKLTRRQILSGATLAAATGAAAGFGRNLGALASVTVGPRAGDTPTDTLVVLFLRGGADGLNVVAPHGDDDYYRLRPTLALARPNERKEPAAARALDLNGFFGLHPALAPLLPFYKEGKMAVAHAVGSGDQTRSHFEAMMTMERGLAARSGDASGWLARHLAATTRDVESPLRAVAIDDTMPDSLRGATNVTALRALAEFRLTAPAQPKGTDGKNYHPDARTNAFADTLRDLYGGSGSDSLNAAGRETLNALDAIKRLDPANYRPAPGAAYPDDIIGQGFRQAACLVKGDVGVEVCCLDMDGWDTHVAQGRDAGWQPNHLKLLGGALAAFATDIGPKLETTTIVVMTEFGRRAYENTGFGTDHGRASCLFLLGGGVKGGQVHAQWPGLAKDKLEDGGDLKVTTDYRDILAEVLSRRLHNPHLTQVFPGYVPRFPDLLRQA